MIKYYTRKKYIFTCTENTITVTCRWNDKWVLTVYCPPSEGININTIISRIKNTKSDILITKSNYHNIVG